MVPCKSNLRTLLKFPVDRKTLCYVWEIENISLNIPCVLISKDAVVGLFRGQKPYASFAGSGYESC